MKLFLQYSLNMLILSLLIIFSFRESGLDYIAYYNEFLDPIKNKASSEIGYKLLIYAINPYFGFWFLLFICNMIFYYCHIRIINKFYSLDKLVVFIIYFTFLSLFLILGSPRRLIANSLVVFILYKEVFWGANNKNYFLAIIASLFHTSALIIIPVIYSLNKKIKDLFKLNNMIKFVFFSMIIIFGLYYFGIMDLIKTKVDYYIYFANDEQEYIKDVPSVYSGLVKRALALFLMWFAIRNWSKGKIILKIAFFEIILYGVLGSFSSVLSVVATYFSVIYIFPFMCLEFKSLSVLKKMSLYFSVIIYFVPTIFGLIKLFGSYYV